MRDESGATAIEYGLIAALLGTAIISAAKGLDTQVNSTFNAAANTMKNA